MTGIRWLARKNKPLRRLQLVLTPSDLQLKDHYHSDYHRYNLKRKVLTFGQTRALPCRTPLSSPRHRQPVTLCFHPGRRPTHAHTRAV